MGSMEAVFLSVPPPPPLPLSFFRLTSVQLSLPFSVSLT